MAVNRTGKQVTQYLGADITARNINGQLQNVVNNGVGGERPPQADSQRGATSDYENGALNIGDYEAALVYMERNGAEPLAAKAMALVLLDSAAAQGLSVNKLLRNSSDVAVALQSPAAYTYINQLRSISSQLSGSNAIDNSKSLRSRYLLA